MDHLINELYPNENTEKEDGHTLLENRNSHGSSDWIEFLELDDISNEELVQYISFRVQSLKDKDFFKVMGKSKKKFIADIDNWMDELDCDDDIISAANNMSGAYQDENEKVISRKANSLGNMLMSFVKNIEKLNENTSVFSSALQSMLGYLVYHCNETKKIKLEDQIAKGADAEEVEFYMAKDLIQTISKDSDADFLELIIDTNVVEVGFESNEDKGLFDNLENCEDTSEFLKEFKIVYNQLLEMGHKNIK